jgi:hypothetical protein
MVDMTMDISTFTSAASAASDFDPYGGYGLEVLCANWTPMVAVIVEPVSRACELLVDTAATDVDTFLMRFYQSQRG